MCSEAAEAAEAAGGSGPETNPSTPNVILERSAQKWVMNIVENAIIIENRNWNGDRNSNFNLPNPNPSDLVLNQSHVNALRTRPESFPAATN